MTAVLAWHILFYSTLSLYSLLTRDAGSRSCDSLISPSSIINISPQHFFGYRSGAPTARSWGMGTFPLSETFLSEDAAYVSSSIRDEIGVKLRPEKRVPKERAPRRVPQPQKRNPRDPFQVLSDDELHLIIALLDHEFATSKLKMYLKLLKRDSTERFESLKQRFNGLTPSSCFAFSRLSKQTVGKRTIWFAEISWSFNVDFRHWSRKIRHLWQRLSQKSVNQRKSFILGAACVDIWGTCTPLICILLALDLLPEPQCTSIWGSGPKNLPFALAFRSSKSTVQAQKLLVQCCFGWCFKDFYHFYWHFCEHLSRYSNHNGRQYEVSSLKSLPFILISTCVRVF